MNKLALYGSDFYNRISKDLRTELPDVKSFSVTNLRYMCWFYELYFKNPQQLVEDSQTLSNSQQLAVYCLDETVFKTQVCHFQIYFGNLVKYLPQKAVYMVS